MMGKFLVIFVAAYAGFTTADTHYLLSGFFSGTSIAALEFDDAKLSLNLINDITINANSSKWISLDESKENLYVGAPGYFQSYSITSGLELDYQSSASLPSNCSNANYIVAAIKEPHAVFGAPFNLGCSALAISVDAAGSLQSSFANITYDNRAGVHGLALSPQADFIYSADDTGNAVWVHSYNQPSAVIKEVQRISAPDGSDPRHIAVHPAGLFVYVVYEKSNELAIYTRNKSTGRLVNTNVTYSLIPSSFSNYSSYYGDEVAFSIPGEKSLPPRYLICSTRSLGTTPGYVTAFALDPLAGNITSQLFVLPTTGTGGQANAVSPASFSEEHFATTDTSSNFIEVWKIESNKTSTSAFAAAHVDLDSAPANAVWYT
ncbi:uncharacterized protein BHQ10_006385 [Talaromyces amestolkiae]|uniref:Carboxy-cis,cis-muconate cyclase n=1 Tax=Talaromyces amestolkiae TaxID=1196081 RepID=A0A364L3N0_TALAM|nr:uncharacterized protein BHQ10_006385 [Talaromyces amestolkiae]RAO70373.1 hypothetical protein BHQ10_006385 [Talaromyces amestolkiae]